MLVVQEHLPGVQQQLCEQGLVGMSCSDTPLSFSPACMNDPTTHNIALNKQYYINASRVYHQTRRLQFMNRKTCVRQVWLLKGVCPEEVFDR